MLLIITKYANISNVQTTCSLYVIYSFEKKLINMSNFIVDIINEVCLFIGKYIDFSYKAGCKILS